MKTLRSSKPDPKTGEASPSSGPHPRSVIEHCSQLFRPTFPSMGMATNIGRSPIQYQAIARGGDSFAW